MLREWIAIALGGLVGTLVRHWVSSLTRAWNPAYGPLATLLVNLAGCMAIGMLFRWCADRQYSGQWWELGLRVGVLGGLTTFSSFALETVIAWQNQPWMAVALVAAHVVLGTACVLLGMYLAG